MRKFWAAFQGLSKVQKWLYTAAAILVAGGVISGAVLLAGSAGSSAAGGQEASSSQTVTGQPSITSETTQTVTSQTVTSVVESSAPQASSAPVVTSRPAVSSKPATSSKVVTSTPTSSAAVSSDSISQRSRDLMATLDMDRINQENDGILAFRKSGANSSIYCGEIGGVPYFWLGALNIENEPMEKGRGLFYYTQQDGFVPLCMEYGAVSWFARFYKGKFYFLKQVSSLQGLELWCVDTDGRNAKILHTVDVGERAYLADTTALDKDGNMYFWLKYSQTEQVLVRINLDTFAFEKVAQIDYGHESKILLAENCIYTANYITGKQCLVYRLNYDGSQLEEIIKWDRVSGINVDNFRYIPWRATDEGLYYTVDGSTYYIDAATKTVTKVE